VRPTEESRVAMSWLQPVQRAQRLGDLSCGLADGAQALLLADGAAQVASDALQVRCL
jgi:hypothetical protein